MLKGCQIHSQTAEHHHHPSGAVCTVGRYRIAPLGFNTDVVILALLRKSTLLEPARPQAKSFSALPQHMVRRLSAAALVANAQLLHTFSFTYFTSGQAADPWGRHGPRGSPSVADPVFLPQRKRRPTCRSGTMCLRPPPVPPHPEGHRKRRPPLDLSRGKYCPILEQMCCPVQPSSHASA